MDLNRVRRPVEKLLAAVLVTIVIAAGVTVAAPSTANATSAPTTSAVRTMAVSPAYTSSYYEYGVQHWVNVVRQQHGLRALRLATCTDAAGERWSAYLASHNVFYHQSMTRLLYTCNAYYAGETLGRGSITPHTLVTMWMHSTPHRAVLMSRSPNRIGIGATPNAYGEWVVAAEFMKM